MTTEITLDQLTTKIIDGDGIFDGLMQAVSAHIQREYENNRIKGSDYSTVYLGALQSTLNESVRFLLEKNSIALQEAQIDKIRAEIDGIRAEIDKSVIEKDKLRAEIDRSVAETDRLRAEIDRSAAETDRLRAEIDKSAAETDRLRADIVKAAAETDKLRADIDRSVAETDRLRAEIDKSVVETDRLRAEITKSAAETDRLRADIDKSVAEIDRLNIEVELLGLKKNTELVQQDVLRKQQELYTSQAKSFPVDLEIKWRRLQYEYRIAQYTTNELGTEPVFSTSIFDAKFPNN